MHGAEVVERARLVEGEAERPRRFDSPAVDPTVATIETWERRWRGAAGERWKGWRGDARGHRVRNRVFVRPRHHRAFRDLDRGRSELEALDRHVLRWTRG